MIDIIKDIICQKCGNKGEIVFRVDYLTSHLIACPDCMKENRKIGVCRRRK